MSNWNVIGKLEEQNILIEVVIGGESISFISFLLDFISEYYNLSSLTSNELPS